VKRKLHSQIKKIQPAIAEPGWPHLLNAFGGRCWVSSIGTCGPVNIILVPSNIFLLDAYEREVADFEAHVARARDISLDWRFEGAKRRVCCWGGVAIAAGRERPVQEPSSTIFGPHFELFLFLF
jgi:hypothetical protein